MNIEPVIRYHIKTKRLESIVERIRFASDQELEKWAQDPDCHEMEMCANVLAERRAEREKSSVERLVKHENADEVEQLAQPDVQLEAASTPVSYQKRQESQVNPFDPRTEISADARYVAGRIVKHLWILFVFLPVILGLLYALVTAR
jgi:hypothetical protein